MTYISSYKHILGLKRAMQDLVIQHNVSRFVTLVFNQDTVTPIGAKERIGRWHGMIDRKLLGNAWNRAPLDKRTFFIAFLEHPHSNLHYHLLVRPADEREGVYERLAVLAWDKLVPGGSVDVQEIHDVEGATSYAMKGLFRPTAYENVILSNEFSSLY